MRPKNIAIILLNWNGKNDSLECLASLKKLNYPHYKIILADNGSVDNSIQILSALHPEILLVDNKKNLGFAEGNNRAILIALEMNFDYIVLLNNDTTVDPFFLDAFLSLDAQHPRHILGGKICLYSQPDLLDHLGGTWDKSKAAFNLLGYRKKAHLFLEDYLVDYVTGCCLFASREIFEKVGLLDARFFLYWEESDFCQRAKKLGFLSKVCSQAKIFHKVSASFIGGKPHTSYFYWRNRLLYTEKNLPLHELICAWLCIFIPSIFKLIRHYFLLHLQQIFTRLFKPGNKEKKQEQILIIKASLSGIKDYLLRRFYEGPSWIFKKN